MDKRKRRLLCMLEGSGRKSRWISGVPPLQYSAKKQGTLKNYRIYGNTVGGESVGDLVESGQHAGEYEVPVTVEGENLFDENAPVITTYIRNEGNESNGVNGDKFIKKVISVTPNTRYTISWGSAVAGSEGNLPYVRIVQYNAAGDFINRLLFNSETKTVYLIKSDVNAVVWDIRIDSEQSARGQHFVNFMLNSGAEPLPYEPYHAPVTTPIYLPKPIKMVGDEAEYIDFVEQKMHRIGADDLDVTLPALPTLTGTNVLSVGTAVQPSRVEVKGRIKAVGQETEPEQEAAEAEQE